MDLHDLNETETRAELIDPALALAGWGKVENSRVRREKFAPGRLLGGGRRSAADIADYVLMYRGHKLAVIEAKKASLHVTEGLAQAKRYADRLQIRYAYSTNGKGIYRVDMETGEEGLIDSYPTPQELWAKCFSEKAVESINWRERFSEVPFEDKGGTWEARYYQHNAINQTLEAIANGKNRILLTLATGTGKTFIAFQLAWKLFHSRWNLTDWKSGEAPKRRPRILFLADRNMLADQAYRSFSAFPEDALVRIWPSDIRRVGHVPKNGSIFFTIFQSFIAGSDDEGRPQANFEGYPKDFFDFIVIDECHRGGANDESSWRDILNHFSPAVQLGLTATPKRQGNVDTYDYFGEPVYVYSLKEGINDGYLSPFKVRQIDTTMDEYIYTSDDDVVQGEVDTEKQYTEQDFNRVIEIEEREKYRVKVFMDMINQKEKTLVFCATQDHALAVRNLINQIKISANPNYCVRVTANDGKEGERWLGYFQNNDKTIPTILTTSQKLSTGVDALNIRNIVLMRPVNSMIEFKQIVGRGTRLYEGKDYFTVYDFVEAYKHFSDPEWDGDPMDPVTGTPRPPITGDPKLCPDCGGSPCICDRPPCEDCGESPCACEKRTKIVIKLADGKERSIQHMSQTSFWSPEGKPIPATEFIKRLFGDLPALFKDEDELRTIWSKPKTRKHLLVGLEEKGYGIDQLAEVSRMIDAEKSDLFDVLAYIAFAMPTLTRKQRVDNNQQTITEHYNEKQQQFLDFVLGHYIDQGVSELDDEKLPDLLELKYQSVNDAVTAIGSAAEIREVFIGFQKYLYEVGIGVNN